MQELQLALKKWAEEKIGQHLSTAEKHWKMWTLKSENLES